LGSFLAALSALLPVLAVELLPWPPASALPPPLSPPFELPELLPVEGLPPPDEEPPPELPLKPAA